MSGKNKLLQQRAARDRAFYDAGMTTGIQMVHDFVTMALRDPGTMGKDVFGKQYGYGKPQKGWVE